MTNHKTAPGHTGPEAAPSTQPARRVSPEAALHLLLALCEPGEGPAHLLSLVRHLAEAFGVTSAVLVQPATDRDLLHPLALWSRGAPGEESPLEPCGTALGEVLTQGLFHCPEGADVCFPEDGWLRRLGPCGFLGRALTDAREERLGAVALLHDAPLEVGPSDLALLDAFALRASTALERLQVRPGVEYARDFLRNTLNTVPDPLFVKDRSHRWVAMNEAFCRLLGRTEAELIGKSDYDFVPTHDADLYWKQDEQVFTSGKPNENEQSFTDSARVVRTIVTKKATFTSVDGRPFLVVIIRDISAHKRLEAQLRQADRLATVGTMAAGVAHEINNPLAYVSSSLSFLREQLEGADAAALDLAELREAVGDAIEGTGRVRAIVQDLRTFSREDEGRPKEVDLRQVIDSAQRLVRHQLLNHAQWACELEPVPPVLGDPARLGQVLVNLLVNALQAFPRGDPQRNRIRVTTRMREEGRVEVAVEDNGQGMAPEVLQRLFDPFFTTKPAGEGTGLGLTICQSIIQSMDGRIEVSSTLGQGSTFRLVLPCVVRQAPEPPSAQERGQVLPRRRVLFIDDDVSMGDAVRHLLQPVHDVEFVEDARTALQWLARGEHFDAIVCDVIMPGLSGTEFVTELERVNPPLARRTGMMTGAVITPQTRAFIAARASDYLQKPFDAHSLRQFVTRLLS